MAIKIRIKVGNEWWWLIIRDYSISYAKAIRYKIEADGMDKYLVISANPSQRPWTEPIS